MRPAIVTALAVLAAVAAAASAGASTVAHREPTAGPVIAGSEVLWGETRGGVAQVVAGRPGSRPTVRAQWAAPRRSDTTRAVDAIAGSPHTTAALVETCTSEQDYDAIFTSCTPGVFGGPPAGPLSLLDGALPDHGPGSCAPRPASPVSVAAADRRIAVGLAPNCQGPYPFGNRRGSIRLRGASGRGAIRRIPAGRGAPARLALAGRWLTWTQAPVTGRHERSSRVVRLDLRTGTRSHWQLPHEVEALDVQRNGAIAAVAGTCLHVLRPGRPPRELACEVFPAVALDGGRVLYERTSDKPYTGAIVVGRLSGGAARVLQRITPRLQRYGGLDLAGRRATWTVRVVRPQPDGSPGARKTPKIVLRRL